MNIRTKIKPVNTPPKNKPITEFEPNTKKKIPINAP